MIKKIMLFFLLQSATMIHSVQFSSSIEEKDTHNKIVTINFTLDDNEIIIANSIHTSINHPKLFITKTSFSIPTIKKYVPEFGQKKQIYDKNFQAIIEIHNNDSKNYIDAMIHLSYLSTLNNFITDIQIPVSFSRTKNSDEHDTMTLHNTKTSTMPMPIEKNYQQEKKSWTDSLQNLVEKTQSPWMQILFALLLGLLLSLTPCIYPMIPITIGILHSQGKKSLFYDFLGSLCYACGLATTFACLGLVATVAGSSFGSLLSYPPFVIGLVFFIGYMSLTMIGIIDMYIPPFMKGEVKLYKNFGPFVASYLFGAISGTIASPCVSPGLALLLSIVATVGNKVLGFILLFAFGIGLSIPLIIIGTFSNSLYLLPKSGMWMVEIKKALGFFMLATCFYYISNIAPIPVAYWLFTSFSLFTALFYLHSTTQNQNNYKTLHTIISVIMISVTMLMATKSYEKTFYKDLTQNNVSIDWEKNYTIALDQAQKNNKLLLVDFWAYHCTICKAIDKKVFQNDLFISTISNMVTFVKIDATKSDNPEYLRLREQYKVYAQPTILLIDPINEKVLKKWTSEPYNLSIETFIDQIKMIKNQSQNS